MHCYSKFIAVFVFFMIVVLLLSLSLFCCLLWLLLSYLLFYYCFLCLFAKTLTESKRERETNIYSHSLIAQLTKEIPIKTVKVSIFHYHCAPSVKYIGKFSFHCSYYCFSSLLVSLFFLFSFYVLFCFRVCLVTIRSHNVLIEISVFSFHIKLKLSTKNTMEIKKRDWKTIIMHWQMSKSNERKEKLRFFFTIRNVFVSFLVFREWQSSKCLMNVSRLKKFIFSEAPAKVCIFSPSFCSCWLKIDCNLYIM